MKINLFTTALIVFILHVSCFAQNDRNLIYNGNLYHKMELSMVQAEYTKSEYEKIPLNNVTVYLCNRDSFDDENPKFINILNGNASKDSSLTKTFLIDKTVTDNNGNFQFKNPPPGKYVIIINENDRIRTITRFTVHRNDKGYKKFKSKEIKY